MKYDAFISYRHTEKDMYVAKKIHKGLETFNVPGSVEKVGGKKRITRVFRDQEELPIGSDLDDNISEALRESEFLIVICSPNTPESYWVQKEITSFIEMHDRNHVLAVLVEGEPSESFPAPLLIDDNGEAVEPLAADVRGNDNRETNKKLKTELMRLAAPLLHCTYDDLRQRHKERRMKKIIAWVAAVGVIIAGLGIGFGLYNARMLNEINREYEQKQINQSKYLAETSLNLLKKGDRRSAVLVAMAALPDENEERPLVPEAEYALTKALYTYEDGSNISTDKQFKHDLSISKMELSTDKSSTVTVDTNGNVFWWDNITGELILEEKAQYSLEKGSTFVEGALIIDDKLIVAENKSLYMVDREGKELFRHDEDISYCIYSLLSNTVILTNINNAFVFDPEAMEITDRIEYTEDGFFVGSSSVSDDGRYISFSVFNSENTDFSLIYQFDRETDRGQYTKIPHCHIIDTSTGTDGTTYILCNDTYFSDYDTAFSDSVSLYLCAYGFSEEEPLWENEYDISYGQLNFSKSILKVRDVKDREGNDTTINVLLINDTLYALDSQTGKKLSSIGFSSSVANVLTTGNGYAYIGVAEGTINVCDLFTGIIYEDNNIETNLYISDFKMQGGYIAIKSGSATEITLLKGHTGPDYKKIEQFDTLASKSLFSKEDNVFALCFDTYNGNYTVFFYDAETEELIDRWEHNYSFSTNFVSFLDNGRFIHIDSDGNIALYDYRSKKETSLAVENEFAIIYCKALSANSQYMAINVSNCLYLVNLETNEIRRVNDKKYDDGRVAVSGDGSKIYTVSDNTPLEVTDTKTGETRTLNEDCYTSNSSFPEDAILLSPDGKYLAVSSSNNTLMIIDAESGALYDEFPFSTRLSIFLAFSEDRDHLYFQGDNNYFHVYSLKEKKIVHIDTETYSNLTSITEYDDTLVLKSSYNLRLITRDSFSKYAEIPYGFCYVKNTGKIYAIGGRNLSSFVYADLTTLRERALDEYKDDMLTDLEKTKYHVE